MMRAMMKGKIHRARVTEANLNYVGSITIDSYILEQVDILPHEKVQIVNNHNGARLETYVIAGERHSGVICLNGAAARLVQPDDVIIIVSYAMVEQSELQHFQPKVALMNDKNEVVELINEEPPFVEL
ncbi:aspartate 1-decarboxylase [Pontibacillus litoralis]|uniref:Aspartate 1-decarboxylase n=1 Tax=Pontibacillus litoralis JSM 072002 TaxID=1385512 RepID=A0A0A5G9Z4_9BACI|nr:aspartate 1-decarboxylase [Pontibacillus litoralis]KGX87940.1 aspartate decarboxylase [Pontibacillus litoralis JSM 072002]